MLIKLKQAKRSCAKLKKAQWALFGSQLALENGEKWKFFFEIFKILAKFLDHLNWKTKKKISGNHLRMSWNGEKCKKNFLEIFKILLSFWTIWTEKQKKIIFGNHLRMLWNGEKCKKIFLEIFKILAKFLDHLNWKTKKKILEIISECHEMARNEKKFFGNFQNFG